MRNLFSQNQYFCDLSLVFLLSALVSLFGAQPLLGDPDVCWHIAAGDMIRMLGKIPFFDSWSYIGQKQQWYNISWLWDIICSFLHDALGLTGLSILMDLLNAALITYVYHNLKKENFVHDAVMVSTALIGLILLQNSYLRPQMASFFLMLYFHNTISEIANKPLSSSFLFKLFITICLWVNTHGSFFLAFIILGAYIVDAFVKSNFEIVKKLLTISIFCALLTLLNPIGYKIYIGVFRTLDSVIVPYINEWGPFVFGKNYSSSLLILSIIVAGVAFSSNYGVLKIRLADWLIGIFCLTSSMISIRNFIPFAILGRFFIAAVIDRVITTPKIKSHLSIVVKKVLILFLLVAFPLAAISLNIAVPDKKIGANRVPIKTIEFVANNYPGQSFFNHYNIGGYIIFFGKGKFKHFVDGRAGTVFTEEDLKVVTNTLNEGIDIENIIESQSISGFIMSNNMLKSVTDKHLIHSKLKEVYSDDHYKVFIKIHEKNQG